MIAVDTNVLVYASRADSPLHPRAESAVRALAEGRRRWAIPYQCVAEFMAVVTSPRIFRTPTPLAVALDQIDVWAESPSMEFVGEPSNFWPRYREALREAGVVGPRAHDARIAAICDLAGADEIWTADRDFDGLVGPRPTNPVRDLAP